MSGIWITNQRKRGVEMSWVVFGWVIYFEMRLERERDRPVDGRVRTGWWWDEGLIEWVDWDWCKRWWKCFWWWAWMSLSEWGKMGNKTWWIDWWRAGGEPGKQMIKVWFRIPEMVLERLPKIVFRSEFEIKAWLIPMVFRVRRGSMTCRINQSKPSSSSSSSERKNFKNYL